MLGSKTERWMFLGFVVCSLCKDEERAANCRVPGASLPVPWLFPLLTAPRTLVFSASFPGTRSCSRTWFSFQPATGTCKLWGCARRSRVPALPQLSGSPF